MTHSEMDELYELYVLGALEPEPAAEIGAHVREQCPYCLEHIQEALATAAAMSGLAEQKTPPRRLRNRVLANVVPKARKPYPWALVLGLSAACLALVGFAIWAGINIITMGNRLDTLTAQRNELRAAVQVLSRPETQKIGFAGAVNAPHGRVFVNRSGFVFVGSQMPGLPANSTFELWLIPANGAPQPAGLFRPNAQGNSVRVGVQPVDVAQVKAFAVTVEPRQGSKAPSTSLSRFWLCLSGNRRIRGRDAILPRSYGRGFGLGPRHRKRLATVFKSPTPRQRSEDLAVPRPATIFKLDTTNPAEKFGVSC